MADIDNLLLAGLALDRTYDGFVSVEFASVSTGIKIVRSVRDYPLTHLGGTAVYTGTAAIGEFTDEGITEYPKVYYYTLWYDDAGVWRTDPILQSHIMMVRMGEFIDIVKERLIPRLYHSGWEVFDSTESLAALVSLVLIPPLEEFRNLAKALTVVLDIDEAPGSVLPGFARLLGLEPNTELSIRQQRDEVKQAFYIWKGKGTLDVVNIICNVIAGVQCFVDEWGDNVLLTNMVNEDYPLTSPFFSRYNRVSAEPGNPDFGESGQPGDKASYTPETSELGNKYNFIDYGVYIPMSNTLEFTELQSRKIDDKVELLSPLGSRGNVILNGRPVEDPVVLEGEQVSLAETPWP